MTTRPPPPKDKRQPKRVRTPTILQMEATECGAAALGMILAYHGRFLPLEKLRIECGVSRDGTKASDLVKVARRFGLEAKGFKVEPKALRELPRPLIVYWQFLHYLVVEGFADDVVFVNDPASGPRPIPLEEFEKGFTGVALTFAPGPTFERGGERPRLVGDLAKRLTGSHAALVFVVLAGLGLVIPGILIPTFARVFVDEILVGGARSWVRPLLLAMLITALLRGALTWLEKRYLGRLETRLALVGASRFVWHLLRVPVEFFGIRSAGDLGKRVALNDSVAQVLSGDLATNALNLMTATFFAGLMVLQDRVLGSIGILVAILNLLVLRYVAERRVLENLRVQQDLGRLYGTSVQGLQTIEVIKAAGGEDAFFVRWAGNQAKVINAQQRLGISTLFLNAVPPFLTSLNTVVILGMGSLRVMDGQMSMGLLVAFQSLMTSFLQPVAELVQLGSVLQDTKSDMSRIGDVLEYERDLRFADGAIGATAASITPESRRLAGQVEFRHVTFGYSRLAPPLITDLNLTVRPGSRVALVGDSGSGKSTLAKLLCGLYRPWEGEILFDGIPREKLSSSGLSSSLAAVDQDIYLFEGTVRDNLTLWDRSISDAQVTEAARDAEIHEDISARSGGYEHKIEEDGANFSGGQRQRLEIARALVSWPAILLLDEATSALDPVTEQRVDENIRRRGCTSIIVAHRLSTIRDCDQILVLENGRIAERGNHEELIQAGGRYARLIESE